MVNVAAAAPALVLRRQKSAATNTGSKPAKPVSDQVPKAKMDRSVKSEQTKAKIRKLTTKHASEEHLLFIGQLAAESVIPHDIFGKHGAQRKSLRVERRHDGSEDSGSQATGKYSARVVQDQRYQNRSP